MTLVSVIIPTFNRLQMLKRAVASVLSQTFKDFELIVVQNGEREDSKVVVEELNRQGHAIRYVYETNPGGANARNVGVREAKGEYIAFLDDDDEWLPSKLEKQVKVLDRDSEVGLVTCRGWDLDEAGRVREEVPNHFLGNPTFFDLVSVGNVVDSLSTVLVRKECFDQLGLFEAAYTIANDYEFYLRVARTWRIVCLNEPLFRYYTHGENASFNNRYRMWKESLEVLSRQRPLEAQGVTRKEIRNGVRLYAKNLHAMALEAMDKKQYAQATRYYFETIRYSPFIGTDSPWSRFSNSIYRVLKPYLSMGYCAFLSLAERNSHVRQ